MRRINSLRAQLRDSSLPMRMLGCVPIYATVLGIEFEESSTRYVITFKADREGAEPETIRSDRTDGRDGDFVKKLWGNPHHLQDQRGDVLKEPPRQGPHRPSRPVCDAPLRIA